MKKIIITSILTAVLTAGLIAGLFLIREKQEIREKAQAGAEVLVSLSPASQTINKGATTTINIVLTNNSSPARDLGIYAAEADLTFDTSFFDVAAVSCNSSFLSSTNYATVAGNQIRISCFAPGGTGSRTLSQGDTQTLGRFEIMAKDQEGTSPISITHTAVADETGDLSGGTGTGGSYTVSGVGGGSPTSTPTTPPGGTSGGGATATPKATVKATPKPTVKPKKSPTPRTSPRVSATPVVILPIESPTPFAFETFPPEAQEGGFDFARYLVLGGAGLVILGILIWIVKKLFGERPNPPKINPPSEGGRSTQTVNMVPPVMPPQSTSNPPTTGI